MTGPSVCSIFLVWVRSRLPAASEIAQDLKARNADRIAA
jgi:hypothetical protein